MNYIRAGRFKSGTPTNRDTGEEVSLAVSTHRPRSTTLHSPTAIRP